MPSIFTKILNREIPAYFLHEEEHCFSFLDIQPIHLGHSLVVPRVEVDHWMDLPEPHYSAAFRAAQRLSKAIQVATGCPRVGSATVGFEVPHAHYHLIPLWSASDFSFRLAKKREPEEMRAMQEKIRAALGESR